MAEPTNKQIVKIFIDVVLISFIFLIIVKSWLTFGPAARRKLKEWDVIEGADGTEGVVVTGQGQGQGQGQGTNANAGSMNMRIANMSDLTDSLDRGFTSVKEGITRVGNGISGLTSDVSIIATKAREFVDDQLQQKRIEMFNEDVQKLYKYYRCTTSNEDIKFLNNPTENEQRQKYLTKKIEEIGNNEEDLNQFKSMFNINVGSPPTGKYNLKSKAFRITSLNGASIETLFKDKKNTSEERDDIDDCYTLFGTEPGKDKSKTAKQNTKDYAKVAGKCYRTVDQEIDVCDKDCNQNSTTGCKIQKVDNELMSAVAPDGELDSKVCGLVMNDSSFCKDKKDENDMKFFWKWMNVPTNLGGKQFITDSSLDFLNSKDDEKNEVMAANS
jgi:hypothetical protein